MIRKILVRDYQKGYGNMTADERRAFVGRVGEWLAQDGARLLAMTDRPLARSQSLMTVTTRWTAEDCRAMAEGISLLSAMVAVADTWLPTQIYMKSAYRAVRQVVAILAEIPQGTEQGEGGTAIATQKTKTTEQRGSAAHYNHEPKRAAGAGAGKPQALLTPVGTGPVSSPSAKQQDTAAVQTGKPLPMIKTVGKEYDAATDTVRVQCAVVPARPKHIDQYVHLLPKETQERAAGYGELMRQLSEARDNMQLLMDDEHASAKSREQWAKQATRIDKKIRAIRDELDREWEKVAESRRVVIDGLGMAHLVPTSQCDAALNGDGESSGTTADGDGGEQVPVELTSEQKKRRRDLRKWLIDLRRGKEGKDREKRIGQWRVNWKEYLTLEPKEKALQDEKILEAAKHFGIDLTQIVTN